MLSMCHALFSLLCIYKLSKFAQLCGILLFLFVYKRGLERLNDLLKVTILVKWQDWDSNQDSLALK